MKGIKIKGERYPAAMTMGAMLRYKEETGRDLSAGGMTESDMMTLLYCCVVSACRREGRKFDMSLMDMADYLDMDEFAKWCNSIVSEKDVGEQDKKKA